MGVLFRLFICVGVLSAKMNHSINYVYFTQRSQPVGYITLITIQ